MAFIFRSTLRASASTSRVSPASMLTPTLTPFVRYNSALPPASSPNSSDRPPTIPGMDKLKFDDFLQRSDRANQAQRGEVEESDQWWAATSKKNQGGFPTSTWTGRSVLVPKGGEFVGAYRRLQGLLRNSNIKTELRLGEFHEKPSVRRRRLLSERHRRRFKEMVRNKVQQVMSMRNRG